MLSIRLSTLKTDCWMNVDRGRVNLSHTGSAKLDKVGLRKAGARR